MYFTLADSFVQSFRVRQRAQIETPPEWSLALPGSIVLQRKCLPFTNTLAYWLIVEMYK